MARDMDETGSAVIQAFCSACGRDIDATVLEPLDEFACRRCKTIQSFGADQLDPLHRSPSTNRIFIVSLSIQVGLYALLVPASRYGGVPTVRLLEMMAGCIVVAALFHKRIKSPLLNLGLGLFLAACVFSSTILWGYGNTDRPDLNTWTLLVFVSVGLFCTGLFLLVGEGLRIARSTKA